ncbi:MAG: DnaJ domain-containing protein [Candidatus Aminicenantes bacterium]|nr:DnaJ domain-containing protein [Candidatus Aminicenantes bacterium]
MSSVNHVAVFLKDIFFHSRTGRLSVKKKDTEKYFFFYEGKPFKVKTNVKSERLGEILFKTQTIKPEIYDRIDDYITSDQPLGETLKKTGIITENDLKEALAFQIRESLLNVFSCFDAEISFQERKDLKPPDEFPVVDIPFLIDYGIRRLKYDSVLRKFFLGKKVSLKNRKYEHFLTDEEKILLDRFSTTQIIDQMAIPARFSNESFFKALFLFYCLDMIDVSAADTSYRKDDYNKEKQGKETISQAEARLEEIKELKSTLRNKNYYEILGVSRVATEEEIKKAYFALARKYHPDCFPNGFGNEALINEVFDLITTAYRTLSDPGKRKRYDAQLAEGAQDSVDDLVKKAEIKYRQGRTLFQQGLYEEAIIFLEEAIRLRKNKPDYYLLLAMAEAKLPAFKKKAEEDFLKVIEMEPWNPEAYLGLGLLYLGEGLKIKARKYISKALEIDPEHHQARAALEKLDGEKKKGGFFSFDLSKLFKKKK